MKKYSVTFAYDDGRLFNYQVVAPDPSAALLLAGVQLSAEARLAENAIEVTIFHRRS